MLELILDESEVDALRLILRGAGRWVDGRSTAGGLAAEVKRNRQYRFEDEALYEKFRDVVHAGIKSSKRITYFARPKTISEIRVSLYCANEGYGLHSDFAVENDFRSDLSFTLFLTGPDEYDGGELNVRINGQWERVKGDKGALFVYPSGALHEVARVSRGERLVIVGWIQSEVRNNNQREILEALSLAIDSLEAEGCEMETLQLVNQSHYNLLRMWRE